MRKLSLIKWLSSSSCAFVSTSRNRFLSRFCFGWLWPCGVIPSIRMYIFSDYDLKGIERRVMSKYDEDNGHTLLITRVRIDEQQ